MLRFFNMCCNRRQAEQIQDLEFTIPKERQIIGVNYQDELHQNFPVLVNNDVESQRQAAESEGYASVSDGQRGANLMDNYNSRESKGSWRPGT